MGGRQSLEVCAAGGQQYLVASLNEPAADCLLWRWHGWESSLGQLWQSFAQAARPT